MTAVPPCSHDRARVVALLGALDADPEVNTLPWSALLSEPGDAPLPLEPSTIEDLRANVYLGICGGCGAAVVSARVHDPGRWTPASGPAWSTPWAALVRDGAGG
jgi:hypothetical protein